MTAIAREYRKISPDLQDSFMVEFQKALNVVKQHGARMAPIRRDIRVVRLHRFPYGIYYRVLDDAVRVLVVKHLSRDLDFGLDRD